MTPTTLLNEPGPTPELHECITIKPIEVRLSKQTKGLTNLNASHYRIPVRGTSKTNTRKTNIKVLQLAFLIP
jgi:hypothetical protein